MRWEEVIPIICDDDRYKVLNLDKKKEVFEDFIHNLPKQKKVFNKPKQQKEKTISQEENIIQKDIKDYKGFYSLLNELNDLNVHSKWVDVKDKVSNDPRCTTLTTDEQEKEFYQFIFEKFENKKDENDIDSFKSALFPRIGLKTQWDDIKDEFYQFETNIDKEEIFYQLKTEKIELLKRNFNELLIQTNKETKLLHKGTPTFGKKFQDLKRHLSQDQRYKNLDDLEDDRDRMIIEFIRGLK